MSNGVNRDPETRRAYVKEYMRTHPEQVQKGRERARKQQAAKRAADPVWQGRMQIYQELIAIQGGEFCLICKAGPSERKRLFIDHDHDTDEIRGLLCPRCNRLLGAAADSIETLRKCIDYLERPRFTGRRYSELGGLRPTWFSRKADTP